MDGVPEIKKDSRPDRPRRRYTKIFRGYLLINASRQIMSYLSGAAYIALGIAKFTR